MPGDDTMCGCIAHLPPNVPQGYNFYGQLGDNTTTSRGVPTQVVTNDRWSLVAVGMHHTCAVRWDVRAFCWVSLGSRADEQFRELMHFLICFHSTNRLHCPHLPQGRNNYGQLADGTLDDRKEPTNVYFDGWWLDISAGEWRVRLSRRRIRHCSVHAA